MAASEHGTVTGRFDEELLRQVRDAAYLKVRETRFKPKIDTDGFVEGYADPAFVDRFGFALERLKTRTILDAALIALWEKIEAMPAGKTGLPVLDDFPKPDQGAGE